jgi:hypothetical protein
MAAVLSLAGLGQRYLDARWPEEEGVLEALSEEIEDVQRQWREDLARAIRNEVVEAMPKR